MNNWYESVSKWIFLPQNDNLNGQNDDESSNFGEYPILRQAQFWFKDFPPAKNGQTKKNEEKRILCCTLNSRSCWMSLLHSSNRIRPAVQIIAPLRALCVALLYVLPDETKSLKSSNIINLPLWLIRGFGNFKRTPPKKWCSTSFPIRSLKNCHDLWVNQPFLANKSVCFASSSCCTSVWEPQIAEVAFS